MQVTSQSISCTHMLLDPEAAGHLYSMLWKQLQGFPYIPDPVTLRHSQTRLQRPSVYCAPR